MADDASLSPLEKLARRIEVLYLPTYSAENAKIDGETVPRTEVYADLILIVTAIRRMEHRLAAELEHLRQVSDLSKERAPT